MKNIDWKLKRNLDFGYKIFKKQWFGWQKVIADKNQQSWRLAREETIANINRVLDERFEEILRDAKIDVTREYLAEQLEMWIKRDFYQVGFKRERLALGALQTAYENITFTNKITMDVEMQGVDIIGFKPNGKRIGISIKGFGFKNFPTDEIEKHKNKLRNSNFDSTYILYVDEKLNKFSMVKIYG